MRKYFYTDGVNKYGPFSKDELKRQKITRTSKVWYLGLDNWIDLKKVEELDEVFNSIPPELKVESSSLNNISKKENINFHKRYNSISEIIKSKVNKWVLRSLVLIFISVLCLVFYRKQSDSNFYNSVVENSYTTDETFEIYIDKFYRDLNYYGILPKKPNEIIIKFSKLDQLDNTTHIHGITFGNNDDNRIEIYINPSSWKKFTRPMRYFLMYHELAHDILNVDDLSAIPVNEGRLMYPAISSYENKNMDEFIESFQVLFKEQANIR
jgi:glycosyltransferase involved in cell wall biosynthesis